MRAVTTAMTDAWKSQLKAGDSTRPFVRATIQRVRQKSTPYNTLDAPGGTFDDKIRKGTFTSVMFGFETPVYEIPNIRSYNWTRSVNEDVAECTLTILNSELTPIGEQELEEQAGDFDLPGAFTYNRGTETVDPNPWGYTTSLGWKNLFVPDRLVRTYEGYGVDYSVTPAFDENLVQSGTWLIDKVDYNANGDMVLRMRDIGRLLIDQVAFPPVVPASEYPMQWSTIREEEVVQRDVTGGSWDYPTGQATSSNSYYVGEGIVSTPSPYVDSHGGVQGHYPRHAITEAAKDYWTSTGQLSEWDKVWWQIDFHDKTTNISGVRIHPAGGPYKVFVSLYHKDKGWLGHKRIPYEVTTEDVDIEAEIPFIKSFYVSRAATEDFVFPRAYGNISKMRLTLTSLEHHPSQTHPWRGGLRKVKVYTAPAKENLTFTQGEVMKAVGNISDYTHIVKWICAWGGFYWPEATSGDNFLVFETGTKSYWPQWFIDPILPKGRVYGRFQFTGISPVADLTPDLFDKQPLLDAIGQVRDVTGFSFWIDEIGSIIWRMPNLWALGNYLTPHHLDPDRRWGRSDPEDIVIIDDEETLISYSTTLDSSNLRERIFIATSTGKFGVVIKGFNPFPSRFRRVAGWTDGHFKNRRECRVMGDMIAAQQMFSYREAKVSIPGYPAIQIDDQIRIYERVTNETFYHYVTGVTSNLNMETGEWTYDLDTHWLGEVPEDAWVVDATVLPQVTQTYLNTIGDED